jgi:hypothetical protein
MIDQSYLRATRAAYDAVAVTGDVLGGILTWYSTPPQRSPTVFAEFTGCWPPGGYLLLPAGPEPAKP